METITTLETVESAAARLEPAELAAFRRWFADFDNNAWDAQIEADAAAGKLDALATEALAAYHAGGAIGDKTRSRRTRNAV